MVFDCDGTLVDSEAIHGDALRQGLKDAGIEVSWERFGYRVVGVDTGTTLNRISVEQGIRLPKDLESRIEELTRGAMADRLRAVVGAHEVLCSMIANNIALAVASNSTLSMVELMLDTTDLKRYFDGCIATKDEVSAPKPASDIYLLASQKLSIPPQECIAVEDSPAGISAARGAGMKTVGFCPGSSPQSVDELMAAGATLVIAELRELLSPRLALMDASFRHER